MKKIIKNQLILFLLFIFITSCKEKTSYELGLLIKNNTGDNINVNIFAKGEDLPKGLYPISDFGGGYYKSFFELYSKDSKYIYCSDNLKQKPFDLVFKIFDSIHIRSVKDDKLLIRFLPDTVIGYSENIFSVDSKWNYEIIDSDMPTNFRRNPVKLHNYTFTISEDKYKKNYTYK